MIERAGLGVAMENGVEKLKKADTLTAAYMFGKKNISVPEHRRNFTKKITINNGKLHKNNKNIL